MNSKINTNPNAVLTFIFALFPGLPHLYMGFEKKGLTLLGSFAACIVFLALLGNIYILDVVFVVPMIMLYCYSFFNAFSTRRMLLSGLQLEDTCALTRFYEKNIFGYGSGGKLSFSNRFIKILGIVLLVIGILGVFQEIAPLLNWDNNFIVSYYTVFAFIVPVLFVILGIVLIVRGLKGKKQEESV